MKKSTRSRELIAIRCGVNTLWGTCHTPPDHSGLNQRTRIGTLILNYGSTPRAGGSDSAVYWADSFSKLGYPSFRFDLPGLGDSGGELPKEMSDYGSKVNLGAYTPAVSEIARVITDQFKLRGVVIIGHCAGAVAGILGAGACNKIKGLVLVTPYFHLMENSSARHKVSSWAVGSRIGRPVRMAYKRLKNALQTQALPRNANVPLLRCWKQLASAGLPMFIMTKDDPKLHLGYYNYLAYLKASTFPSVTIKSFMEGIGKDVFRETVESWLTYKFPLSEKNDVSITSPAAEVADVHPV